MCPSCNAKRAQAAAVLLVERVPYRPWTLSFSTSASVLSEVCIRHKDTSIVTPPHFSSLDPWSQTRSSLKRLGRDSFHLAQILQ